jgi:hypothetical protein
MRFWRKVQIVVALTKQDVGVERGEQKEKTQFGNGLTVDLVFPI